MTTPSWSGTGGLCFTCGESVEDILADLNHTPEKNDATLSHYAPSDSSKNEDGFGEFEEFDMVSNGDEHNSEEGDSEPGPTRIEFKKKKAQGHGGMLAICQNSIVGAVGYGQSARVWSVGVLDVWMQGSKMQLKLMCFALAARTGVSLYFRGLE